MLDLVMPRLWRGEGWRRAAIAVVVCLGSVLVASAPASAASGIVIGDSLGVGVSMASGLPRLARNSVAIRGGAILNQLREAPAGTTVFMSLGTNDAVGRIDGLDNDIKRIIAAAGASGHQVVWIGPPCVLKAWDTNAQKLDAQLRSMLSGTGIVYVSMRDPSMCAAGARAGDGVHFTMTGYGQMWAKARLTAGFEGGNTAVAQASPGKRKIARHKRKRSRLAKTRTSPDGKTSADSKGAQGRGPASASATPAQ